MLLLGAHAAEELLLNGFYCPSDGSLANISIRSYMHPHLFYLALSWPVSSIKKKIPAPIIVLVHHW